MNDLHRFMQILYKKADDSGASGGEGDDASADQEAAAKENNQDISDITQSMFESDEEDKKDPKSRHIGYFEEDVDDEADAGADSAADSDDSPSNDGPEEIEAEGGTTPAPDDEEAADADSETDSDEEVVIDDDAPFYDPERDAEGRDPYPNSYDTRIDAQFAVAEKVQAFDDYVAKLEENDSSIGAAVPPDVKQKIEKYRDHDYAASVDDDTLRADLVDLDEGLKATKIKVDRVESKVKKSKSQKEAEKKYIKAEKAANKSSVELGVADRLGELPENPDKADLMEIVDEQIEEQLSEVDQAIQEHQNDEEYLEENGLQAYNQRLNELQQQRQEATQELREHRDNIDKWWDAQTDYRAAKDEATDLTDAQKAKMTDDAFVQFQEDASEGPYALDIFTKSKDTKPIVHFRQYALSPANRDKFDLTSVEGWYNAHSDWQSWVAENVGSKKSSSTKKKAQKVKQKKSKKPIPAPSKRGRSRVVPNGTDLDGLREAEADISKLSHSIMRGG